MAQQDYRYYNVVERKRMQDFLDSILDKNERPPTPPSALNLERPPIRGELFASDDSDMRQDVTIYNMLRKYPEAAQNTRGIFSTGQYNPNFKGVYTDLTGNITVNPGNKKGIFSPGDTTNTILHELGHAQGLEDWPYGGRPSAYLVGDVGEALVNQIYGRDVRLFPETKPKGLGPTSKVNLPLMHKR